MAVLRCYQDNCTMESHMVCLAKRFLVKEPDQIIPIDGTCPVGNHTLLWGNLLAFKHGILPVRIKCIANTMELITADIPL